MAFTKRVMPVFSSVNSSVLTRAIFVSGGVAVWVEGAEPGVVVRGWAKTDPALITAKKATAAIARNIFMTLFVILLKFLRGDLIQPVSCSCRPFGLLG